MDELFWGRNFEDVINWVEHFEMVVEV